METIKQGFTLIELLIALVIIALIGQLVLPTFGRKSPRLQQEQFQTRLNALTQLAATQSVLTHAIHKLEFDFKKRTVSLFKAVGTIKPDGSFDFEKPKQLAQDTSVSWPEHLQVKQFLIEGKDEMQAFAGKKTAQSWFYVMPEGLAQQVTIGFSDTANKRTFNLELNPFSMEFVEKKVGKK